MSVRLTDDEAWAVLAASHTGVFTTLRRDGMPVALPVWFVAFDHRIHLGAPSRSKKVARLRRDPRASFLVESGQQWAELRAVHLTGLVEFVDDPAEMERIDAALDEKYTAFRTARTAMPEATQRHYTGRTFLRLLPDARIVSWDNRRIPLGGA